MALLDPEADGEFPVCQFPWSTGPGQLRERLLQTLLDKAALGPIDSRGTGGYCLCKVLVALTGIGAQQDLGTLDPAYLRAPSCDKLAQNLTLFDGQGDSVADVH